jgi:hypothetical protein
MRLRSSQENYFNSASSLRLLIGFLQILTGVVEVLAESKVPLRNELPFAVILTVQVVNVTVFRVFEAVPAASGVAFRSTMEV